jgi:hypothetical protein
MCEQNTLEYNKLYGSLKVNFISNKIIVRNV